MKAMLLLVSQLAAQDGPPQNDVVESSQVKLTPQVAPLLFDALAKEGVLAATETASIKYSKLKPARVSPRDGGGPDKSGATLPEDSDRMFDRGEYRRAPKTSPRKNEQVVNSGVMIPEDDSLMIIDGEVRHIPTATLEIKETIHHTTPETSDSIDDADEERIWVEYNSSSPSGSDSESDWETWAEYQREH